VERGSALTRQLLAFGRKELHAPERLDVHAVVVNVERLLSRALGGGVQLEICRGPGDLHVMVDASQLEQVLVNLAINARDAMPGGGRLVIATSVRALDDVASAALELSAGDYVTVEVSDTGVGMDETTRSRAFEPFYSTKGPLEGTGLGLSTVYGIVRQSGGAVTLWSAPDMGTVVTILFPYPATWVHPRIRQAGPGAAAPRRDSPPRSACYSSRTSRRCAFRRGGCSNGVASPCSRR
jgi:signal transduction histidine kinase